MWRLLRWLFTGDGHKHQWKYIDYVNMTTNGRLVGRIAIYRCEICGKFKRETII